MENTCYFLIIDDQLGLPQLPSMIPIDQDHRRYGWAATEHGRTNRDHQRAERWSTIDGL